MNERKVLDYTGWADRIENTGANATRYLDNLLGLDKRILDMQEKLQGTDIGSFDYESLANNMRASMMGIQVLFEYAMDTERAIDEMDTGFMTALSKGAVEDLSLIRMDDFTVDNTIGMKETYMVGYGDSRCAVERTKNRLTLNDFIGGEGAGCMTGYVKEFADLFRNQYLEVGGKEENFSKYLKELYTMGEFDHKKYQPVKTFLSDILDVVTLGIKPLLEGLLQYEFITGETLTDTESLFKVVEGVVGLITVGTGAYGKGVAVIAQNISTEVMANVTVEEITQLGEELGLPPIVTAILALAGGVAAGKAVNGCFVDEDQLLKQIDVEKLQLEGGTDYNPQSPMFGDDWHRYFNETYGKDNVVWESADYHVKGGSVPKTGLGNTNISIENFTAKDVPSVKNGEFNKFFNSLSVDELDALWAKPEIRNVIESRLRSPGGLHEWHLVSRTPQFKYWDISAEQVRDLRTLTNDVEFVNPSGIHGGRGSTTAHNELLGIIDSSNNYETFVRRLNNWANYRLKGGVDALPEGLQLK